jgi:hypothetical protein
LVAPFGVRLLWGGPFGVGTCKIEFGISHIRYLVLNGG